MTPRILMTISLLVATACGSGGGGTDGGSTSGACTVSFSCTSPNNEGCVESPAGAGSQAQQECQNNGGTYSTSACSRTNALGGCRQGNAPLCTTSWFYSGSGGTAAQFQQACAAGGGTWINP
jgi:hypothetical protein